MPSPQSIVAFSRVGSWRKLRAESNPRATMLEKGIPRVSSATTGSSWSVSATAWIVAVAVVEWPCASVRVTVAE